MTNVLIAEDDLVMADMLEDIVVAAGYHVCGIARTVEEGVALGKLHKPDLALLDLRLADGGLGTEIASQLDRRGDMGVLYTTGNTGQISLTREDGEASLGKPYRSVDLVRAMKIVEEIIDTGQAHQPFPSSFEVLLYPRRDRAKSFGEGRVSRDGDIARLLRQQAALAAFGSFALGANDLGTVLTEAARVCADSLGVPFCKVCRYRKEENDLLVEAGVGWKPGVVGGVVSRADASSPQGRAFSTGKPVICEDLRKDESFVPPGFYAEHGIVATLDVVIEKKKKKKEEEEEGDGRPWGVLEIDNPNPHVYNENDVNFVTGFANVLAEAVNTSKRNAIVQATLDQMKDMLAERDGLVEAQSRLLSEKNVLAQELQHRVRNNLQLVYGMLNKQIQSDDAGDLKEGIGAIARRVMTLAKVYDHLLGTGLTRTIDFGGYLSSLCDSFRDMENPSHNNVKLSCQWQHLMLDLDTATALGLVTTELLSNSFLHAFPHNAGSISVSLVAPKPGGEATISIVDDGVGFVQTGASKRRGLGLVQRLMQQINGSVQVSSDVGTAWTLRVPVPKVDDTIAAGKEPRA